MRKVVIASLCLVLLASAGCATLNINAEGIDNTIAMSTNPGQPYRVIKHFTTETKIWWIVAGLATINEPDIGAIIDKERQKAGGEAVVNVKIMTQFTPIDILISAFTGSLLYTRTIFIEGDVVSWR